MELTPAGVTSDKTYPLDCSSSTAISIESSVGFSRKSANN